MTVTQWPTGWRQALLRHVSIDVTQEALTILALWEQSTPTEPWSHNPLGMPSRGTGAPRALNTPYAAFPSMQAGRDAFAKFLRTSKGRTFSHAMIHPEDIPAVWREIHAFGWPACDTEQDYPGHLLDRAAESYRKSVNAASADRRKTAGKVNAPPDVHDAIRAQGAALHQAATAFQDGRLGIAHIINRMG